MQKEKLNKLGIIILDSKAATQEMQKLDKPGINLLISNHRLEKKGFVLVKSTTLTIEELLKPECLLKKPRTIRDSPGIKKLTSMSAETLEMQKLEFLKNMAMQ